MQPRSHVNPVTRVLERQLLEGRLRPRSWKRWLRAVDSLSDRVLRNCREDPQTGCLIWQGATGDGYGRIKVDGKLYATHRLVAFSAGIVSSPVDPQRLECVMHLCDNPACCNPSHMQAGTMSDNMRDAARKGRLSFPKPRKKA